MSDKRKKGCPNECCEIHVRKVKHKAEINYCPICGTELLYVCSKCFSEIENIDEKHRICALCKAEYEEKHRGRVEKLKSGGKLVATTALPLILNNVKKLVDKGINRVVDIGVESAKGAVKGIVK